MPSPLSVLKFRSNNESWRSILDALSLIYRLNEEGRRVASASLAPEGSIPRKWRDTVMDHRGRLNVISYELCILTQLRERFRAKEIWIEGADRYRNLMTEWHTRYGGCGVMIYWHVERQATCIYSQLKRCSSS
ncbi:Tn3 family transposase, partial [Ruegeria sp. SCPT10]